LPPIAEQEVCMPAPRSKSASPAVPGRPSTERQPFAGDDHRGTAPLRLFCHACERGRPAPGFRRYAAFQFCSLCAAEFEVAQTWAERPSAGQFVRDKQFGEADRYALASA
jgi:hypothetical protein